MEQHVRDEEARLLSDFGVDRVSSDPLLDIVGAEGLTLEVSSFTTDDGTVEPMVTLYRGPDVAAKKHAEDVRLAWILALRDYLPKSLEKRYTRIKANG